MVILDGKKIDVLRRVSSIIRGSETLPPEQRLKTLGHCSLERRITRGRINIYKMMMGIDDVKKVLLFTLFP